MIRLRGFAASARQALATVAVVVIGGSTSLFACPMCFGAEETSMIDGAKLIFPGDTAYRTHLKST